MRRDYSHDENQRTISVHPASQIVQEFGSSIPAAQRQQQLLLTATTSAENSSDIRCRDCQGEIHSTIDRVELLPGFQDRWKIRPAGHQQLSRSSNVQIGLAPAPRWHPYPEGFFYGSSIGPTACSHSYFLWYGSPVDMHVFIARHVLLSV